MVGKLAAGWIRKALWLVVDRFLKFDSRRPFTTGPERYACDNPRMTSIDNGGNGHKHTHLAWDIFQSHFGNAIQDWQNGASQIASKNSATGFSRLCAKWLAGPPIARIRV